MAREIYKHQVNFGGSNLELHMYATIVHAAMMEQKLFIWEEHLVGATDRNEQPLPKENWIFTVWGTGHRVSDLAGMYMATVIDGVFVWHIYGARVK